METLIARVGAPLVLHCRRALCIVAVLREKVKNAPHPGRGRTPSTASPFHILRCQSFQDLDCCRPVCL